MDNILKVANDAAVLSTKVLALFSRFLHHGMSSKNALLRIQSSFPLTDCLYKFLVITVGQQFSFSIQPKTPSLSLSVGNLTVFLIYAFEIS